MSSTARLLSALLIAALPLAESAAAQEADAPSADRLTLASKTPWVVRGGELLLRVQAQAADPQTTELAVAVHSRVTSRSQFVQTLEGRVRGSPLDVVSSPVSLLGPDPAGALTVRLPVQDPGLPREPGRVLLSREGVYPVRVELRELGGGEVLAGFTTHLVYAPESVQAKPLGAAIVLPFHAPPTAGADGGRAAPDLPPLRATAAALASHRGVPLTIDPTPETVEALAQDPRGAGAEVVAELRTGVTGRQVTSSTYVATEPRSLISAGLAGELTAQRTRAARVLSDVLGVRADSRTWMVTGDVDTALLEAARSAQVDRIVVSETVLQPADRTVTLAQPFALESRRSAPSVVALSADPGLARHFEAERGPAEGGPVLAAHQLLADLAVIHFDSPGTPRAAVAVAPRDWRAEPAFLDALLSGLGQSPLLDPVTLDVAFRVPEAETARGGRLVRRPAPADAPPTLPGAAIREARRRLNGFGSLVDPGNRVETALERALLSAQATELTRGDRAALVASVGEGIEAEFARLSLPGNRSITLTARTGEIPITIQSGLDYSVRATLRVESDKLAFPNGSRRELELTNTNTTERFSVRARTSGAFPVRIVLESPEGDLVLGRSLFTVRSTAASGVGVGLSAGAGLFLVVWWGRHVRQTRRQSSHE